MATACLFVFGVLCCFVFAGVASLSPAVRPAPVVSIVQPEPAAAAVGASPTWSRRAYIDSSAATENEPDGDGRTTCTTLASAAGGEEAAEEAEAAGVVFCFFAFGSSAADSFG